MASTSPEQRSGNLAFGRFTSGIRDKENQNMDIAKNYSRYLFNKLIDSIEKLQRDLMNRTKKLRNFLVHKRCSNWHVLFVCLYKIIIFCYSVTKLLCNNWITDHLNTGLMTWIPHLYLYHLKQNIDLN